METRAIAKNVRVTPRKMRTVVDAIKGLPLEIATNKLEFLAKASSEPILKAIRSAIANAKDKTNLKIKNILVDEGIKMKRRDTSHGARFGGGVISKKASHITVILEN